MANGRASLKQKMRPAILVDRIEVCGPEVDIFRVQPREGEVFPFVPGQYATLGLDVNDEFVARAYSIASSAHERRYLEFYINVIEQGQFTPPLFRLNEGDEIHYMGPKGVFTLKKTNAPHLLFIATGTGLAPYVSMLRTLYEDECGGTPHGRTITLIHGVRHAIDLGYRDELEALAREEPFNLMYLPMVSRPDEDPDWSPASGRGRTTDLIKLIGEDLDDRPVPCLPRGVLPHQVFERLPLGSTAVYLCGNPDMISDAKAILAGKGYGELYTEEYW